MSPTTYLCPKGHFSTEADFCSDCGAKISAMGDRPSPRLPMPTMPLDPAATTAVIACPDCGTPHDSEDGHFCDVCGYNFLTGAVGSRFDPGVSLPPPESRAAIAAMDAPSLDAPSLDAPSLDRPSPNPPSLEPAPSVAAAASAWSVTLTVDPSLGTAESPPAPTQAAIALPLTRPTSLIGRTSEARGIFPDVPLDFDTAVSHRHALLIIQDNGTLYLRDVGSSNGTYINGVEVKPMVDTVLQAGDEFTLGHWTRVRIAQSPV